MLFRSVLAAVLAVALASYFIVRGEGNPKGLLAPPVIALVLVANLAGGIALMMLAGRRIARRRAARSPVGGEGRLHVRLVLLFSAVAAVPAFGAVAIRPPASPTGTRAPLSASNVVTRPPLVCVPDARTVTPTGGVSAFEAESLCDQ